MSLLTLMPGQMWMPLELQLVLRYPIVGFVHSIDGLRQIMSLNCCSYIAAPIVVAVAAQNEKLRDVARSERRCGI